MTSIVETPKDREIPWVLEVIIVVVVAVAGYLMGRQVERDRQRPAVGGPGSFMS